MISRTITAIALRGKRFLILNRLGDGYLGSTRKTKRKSLDSSFVKKQIGRN